MSYPNLQDMEEQYSNYLQTHIDNVKRSYMFLARNGIITYDPDVYDSVSMHDSSKWAGKEWDGYLYRFYDGDYSYDDENADPLFVRAFLSHLHNNPHHWQYWVLIPDSYSGSKEILVEIPDRYLIEMLCDWWSFSIKYHDENDDSKGGIYSVFDWYDENKKGIKMNKNSRKKLESMMSDLKKVLDSMDEVHV